MPRNTKQDLIALVRNFSALSEFNESKVKAFLECPSILSNSIAEIKKANESYKNYLNTVYYVEVPVTAREMQIKANVVSVRLRLEYNIQYLEVIEAIKTLYDAKTDLKKVLA